VFPAERFTLEEFIWARAMFDSRGFSVQLDGETRKCLLPVIDSMNSSRAPQMEGRGQYDTTDNCMKVRCA
jgi:hypothetical protein